MHIKPFKTLLLIALVAAQHHAAAASTQHSYPAATAAAAAGSFATTQRGPGWHRPVQYMRVVHPSVTLMRPAAAAAAVAPTEQTVVITSGTAVQQQQLQSQLQLQALQQQQQQALQQQALQQQQQQQQQQGTSQQQGSFDEAGPRSTPSAAEDAATMAANPDQVGVDPFSGSALLGQQQQQQQQQARSGGGRTPQQKFPFRQCANATLMFDVSFVGPVQYAQVGTVKYAYHKFGPLAPVTDADLPQFSGKAKKAVPSPVVFVSGWGTSMYIWPIPLLKALASTRPVVIFDTMRTGGSTDTSRTPLTIPQMAESVAGLLQQLRLDKPDVWSWSLGACIGYALLAKHAAKLGNVILASGTPGGTSALLPPVGVWQQAAGLQQDYDDLLPFLFPEGMEDTGICNYYAAFNSFSSAGLLSTPLGKESLEEQGKAITAFFKDNSVVSRLKDVPNRVLILHGVQDRLMPIRNAVLGAQQLLGSWMLQFPGEGHGVPFDNQPAVIAMTQEFFSFATPLTAETLRKWASYGETWAQSSRQQAAQQPVSAERGLGWPRGP